jgi:hypothetical protein
MASPYGPSSPARTQHSYPGVDPRPSSQYDAGLAPGPSARPPRQGQPGNRTSRHGEPVARSSSAPLSDVPVASTRYRPPSQQILMADAYRAPAGEDGFSERGPPSEADQDDFYAARNDYAQSQYVSQEEDAASLAPTTATGPLLDQSHLRPGKQAALLSHERTLELYRANAKKACRCSLFAFSSSYQASLPDTRSGPPVRVRRVHDRRLQDTAHPGPHPRERNGGREGAGEA